MNWHYSLDKLLQRLAENIPLTACEQAYLQEYLPTDLLPIDGEKYVGSLPRPMPHCRSLPVIIVSA